MEETRETAIARLFAAEDAVVATNFAAAVLLALRGLLGRRPQRRLIIQRAHATELVLGLTPAAGAALVEIGGADRCGVRELEDELSVEPAGAVFVRVEKEVGQHIGLADFLFAARTRGCTVACLDPASGCWSSALDLGAGLVALDAVALGAPRGALILGNGELVGACRTSAPALGAVCLADAATAGDVHDAAVTWASTQPERAGLPIPRR